MILFSPEEHNLVALLRKEGSTFLKQFCDTYNGDLGKWRGDSLVPSKFGHFRFAAIKDGKVSWS